MENKAWAKTMLEVYRYLETICSSIDDIVKKTSLSGFGNSLNTKYSADKIIELTYKKQTLINMKILVEKSLNKLKDSDTKILTLFYVDGIKAKDLSSMYNINIRTFFRRKTLALDKLYEKFVECGYTKERLFDELRNEHWILNIYNNNLSFLSLKKEPEINYKVILNRAIIELKNYNKRQYAVSL